MIENTVRINIHPPPHCGISATLRRNTPADEEETLFPSLRPLDSPGAQAVVGRVDSLESDSGFRFHRDLRRDKLRERLLKMRQSATL
jgi:hypothetical protein